MGRIKLIRLYEQMASKSWFLASHFKSPAVNFHDSEEVRIDIIREDEDVAIAIQDMSTGTRINTIDQYTSKKFKPPVVNEGFAVDAFDVMTRVDPGTNEYEDINFNARVISEFVRKTQRVESKIRRHIELQASQIMTSGKVDLTDANGNTVYAIDYKPKGTHFVDFSTPIDEDGTDIDGELRALAEVILADSHQRVGKTIWGGQSWQAALNNSNFLSHFDNRRINRGVIEPLTENGEGGVFHGFYETGDFRLEIWTYLATYKHPQTGVKTKFMPDNKIVMLPMDTQFDATFGIIPRMVPPDQRVVPFLPNRMALPQFGVDLNMYAWPDQEGRSIFGTVGTRPLLIPTAIDSYGCLDTGIGD